MTIRDTSSRRSVAIAVANDVMGVYVSFYLLIFNRCRLHLALLERDGCKSRMWGFNCLRERMEVVDLQDDGDDVDCVFGRRCR